MKLLKEDLRLFQEIEYADETETIELVDVFDFADLDWETIANNAQERLLTLIVKRQSVNLDLNEVLNCFNVEFIPKINAALGR